MMGPLKAAWRSETSRAALILIFILHICFFQCLWGGRTLLESAQDAPSILLGGAATGKPVQEPFLKVLDPGAPAWQSEAYLAFSRNQYLDRRSLPLWDPYQAYGKPFAANMQSQPFYPLTLALAIHLTPRTYNWYILLRLFIAGLCAYLYLRLFLSLYPAIAGAVSAMLAGYYVLYITMPHISVEILLPAGLLSAEYLLRRRSYLSLITFAVLLLLVFLGGMPESALLLFLFVYLYLALRIWSDLGLRIAWWTHIRRVLAASLAGLCLSAFFVLPFIAYIRHSSNSHDPAYTGAFFRGLEHDRPGISVFTYLVPLLFGPLDAKLVSENQSPLRNYIGILAFFLIIAAAIGMAQRRTTRDRVLRAITCFFLLSMIFVVLKRYGLLINTVGELPLLRLIEFPKYGQAILSISAAMLCAIGLERLMNGELSKRSAWTAFGISMLTVAFALVVSRDLIASKLASGGSTTKMVASAIILACCLLAALATWLVAAVRGRISNSGAGIFVAALLTLELTVSYIVPVYFLFNKLPRRTQNPYAGAPFVDFLKSRASDYYRVFGRDGVLVPNWSSVFGIYDIRDLDAVYEKKYFPFLENFFPLWQMGTPELESCFRGLGEYSFENPLQKRLLQLSSVKYLASVRPYSSPNARIDELLAQNAGRLTTEQQRLVHRTDFDIDGVYRTTLGEHPPSYRLPYTLTVPREAAIFRFSYGLDSGAFDKGGDGVGFTLEVRDNTGRITKLFSNYIDPKHNGSERKWMDGAVDLAAFRGRRVALLFSTDPGPRGDSAFDWAGWSNLRFEGDRDSPQAEFRQIYSGEPSIFEYDNVLPRAAIFSQAELVSSDPEVLHKLADLSLDVFHTVVLNASELDQRTKSVLATMNNDSGTAPGEASIASYQPSAVSIKASLRQPGILMLNDTADADWKATVDNKPARWFSADYMFRGILLTAGTHTVEFVYKPQSFYSGALISSVTAILLIGYGVFRSTRNSVRKQSTSAAVALTR